MGILLSVPGRTAGTPALLPSAPAAKCDSLPGRGEARGGILSI